MLHIPFKTVESLQCAFSLPLNPMPSEETVEVFPVNVTNRQFLTSFKTELKICSSYLIKIPCSYACPFSKCENFI